MATRILEQVIPSIATSDGAGVKLRRSLGARQTLSHDPFLMLDEFYSENPDDYLAGFPPHPHRGFETVTYMLDGHMRHEDSNGNQGDLGPGDVQWMTAARGIIHSEMPQQAEGRMRGFQLWVNLPAAEKMKPADWRDIPANRIPRLALGNGMEARVISGTLKLADIEVTGPVPKRSTEPVYLDLRLPANAQLSLPLPETHHAFVYAYEGAVQIGDRELPPRAAGLLGRGSEVQLTAGESGAQLLVLAGKPLGEPIAQYGPFVMNNQEEIEQAMADYQAGTLAVGTRLRASVPVPAR